MKTKTVLIVTAIFIITFIGYAVINSFRDQEERAIRLATGSSERPGLSKGEADTTKSDKERKDDE